MTQKEKTFLDQTAQRLHLTVDGESSILFGSVGGYQTMLWRNDQGLAVMTLSLHKLGQEPDHSAIRQFVKGTRLVMGFSVRRSRVELTLNVRFGNPNQVEKLAEAVAAVVEFLHASGYDNCCQNCGSAVETDPCIMTGVPSLLCDSCYQQLGHLQEQTFPQIARADARGLQFVNDPEQPLQLPGRSLDAHREGDVVGHRFQVAAQITVLVDAPDEVGRQLHVALREIAIAQLLEQVLRQRTSFGEIDRPLLVVLRIVVDAALVRRRVVLPEVFVEGDLLGRLLLVLGRTLLLFQHDIVFDLLFDALFELHGGQFQQLDHLYLLRRELLLKRKYLFLINSHIGSKLRIVQHSEFGLFIYRVSGFSKVVQGGRIPVFGKSGAAGAHSSMWLSRTAREGRKAPHSDGFRQKSACWGVRGNGCTSRMLVMPVTKSSSRSKPSPKPEWGADPQRRVSRYHQSSFSLMPNSATRA